MMVRQIPHFPEGDLQIVLIVNMFRYMVFYICKRASEVTEGEKKKNNKMTCKLWGTIK